MGCSTSRELICLAKDENSRRLPLRLENNHHDVLLTLKQDQRKTSIKDLETPPLPPNLLLLLFLGFLDS